MRPDQRSGGGPPPAVDANALLERMRLEAPFTYGSGLIHAYTAIRNRGEDPYPVRERLAAHVRQLEEEGKIRPKGGRQDPTPLEQYADTVDAMRAHVDAMARLPKGSQAYIDEGKLFRAAEINLKRVHMTMLEEANRRETPVQAAPPAARQRRSARGGAER